jgi:hypothetical protein
MDAKTQEVERYCMHCPKKPMCIVAPTCKNGNLNPKKPKHIL